jgi:hypothetical protein
MAHRTRGFTLQIWLLSRQQPEENKGGYLEFSSESLHYSVLDSSL